MITAEKARLTTMTGAMHQDIKTHIEWLQHRLDDLDQQLQELIRQTPGWCEQLDLLKSVPGVGDVLGSTLLVELPELGSLNALANFTL